MGATIEWIAGTIRAGKNYEKWGDTYEFSCSAIRVENVIFILGGCGKPKREYFMRLKSELKSMGITEVRWLRVKNGVMRWCELKL